MDEQRLAAALESRPPEVLLRLVETATAVDNATAPDICRLVVEQGGDRIDLTAVADHALELSHPDAVDVALEAYRRGDDDERIAVAQSLSGQLTPRLARALLAAAEAAVGPNEPAGTIADGTGADDGTEADPTLDDHHARLRAAFDGSMDITRRAAALGLGTIGTDRAIQPLVGALDGESIDRRRDAIAGLSLAPLEQAAGPLARCCHDDDLVIEASRTLRDSLERLEWDEYLVDSVGRMIVDALVAVEDEDVRSTLIHAVHAGVQADVYRDDDELFALLERASGSPR